MMFFDKLSQLPDIAQHSHATVFALPPETKLPITPILDLSPPTGKRQITIEQIRDLISLITTRQTTDQFLIIRQAETLGQESANCLLKSLEEPPEHYHFILLTSDPSRLLPTILSRAELYYPKIQNPLSAPPTSEKKTINIAKQLLIANNANDIIAIADQIHKKKTDERDFALSVLSTTIELAYKSYFATENRQFLAKIPKLIDTHHNIASNGNIRLHLVADLC